MCLDFFFFLFIQIIALHNAILPYCLAVKPYPMIRSDIYLIAFVCVNAHVFYMVNVCVGMHIYTHSIYTFSNKCIYLLVHVYTYIIFMPLNMIHFHGRR